MRNLETGMNDLETGMHEELGNRHARGTWKQACMRNLETGMRNLETG